MNLLKDFYETSGLINDGKQITANILLNPAHDIFKGHFPSIPVVPGVCMMQMVKEILESQLQMDIMLSESSQMKFLSMITPNETPEISVRISYHSAESFIDVQAELYNSERAFFKLKALYKPLLIGSGS